MPLVEVTKESGTDLVTAIWWDGLGVESDELTYQARPEHRQAAVGKLDEGFYPVSISAATFGDSDDAQFQSVWWMPSGATQEIADVRQQRNLALAMLYLGDDRRVRDSLAGDYENEARGALISGFRDFAASPDWLIDQVIAKRGDTAYQTSCLMALSLVPPSAATKQRERLIDFLRGHKPVREDPGIRSAIELLVTNWDLNFKLPESSIERAEFQNVAGDRMIVIRPQNPIWVGSSDEEPGRSEHKEERRQITIDHAFAIASREVTVQQMLRFLPDYAFASKYAATTDRPAIDTTWYDAAKYCRLLSEADGIPESEMCYPPVEEIGPGMTIAEGVIHRTGYRLPTEVEWEYAARGGGNDGRWFGFDPRLLKDHAWTNANSGNRGQSVGRLLPNDYGLFDMLGNAMEWCHAPIYEFDQLPGVGPHSDPGARGFTIYDDRSKFTGRGGAMLYQPDDARATQRNFGLASYSGAYTGFRVVRTVD